MNPLIKKLRTEVESSWETGIFRTSLWKSFTSPETDVEIYASFLLETFHYTKQSPIIQSSVLLKCQNSLRQIVKPFLKHALEEESHFRLCLHDLKKLGYDAELLASKKPLPATEGYIGFIFNRINNISPLAYFGYLYQLEYMSTNLGPKVLKNLINNSSIPRESLSFLTLHAEDDIDHLAELEGLISETIEENSFEEILYTSWTSSQLYCQMMEAASKRSLR